MNCSMPGLPVHHQLPEFTQTHVHRVGDAHYEKRWAGGAQAGIKIDGRNINNLRYANDTTFMAESEEELKGLLMKVKEGKHWLKTQHSEN